jgi:GPH family glycoside/pentoside/hexuronide:cation symporter
MSTSKSMDKGIDQGIDKRTKLFYGFGSVAYGVKDNGFRGLLLIYYNQVVGLPASLVAMAIMIALVIDAISDPIVGQISDTWHSKWGRRHPFMYAAAVPSALTYLLLWNPPTDWSQSQLLAYLVVTAVVVRTFITFYEIPSAALVSEFTNNYDERTSLMSYRYLFFFWGSLALSILTYRVLFVTSATHPVGQLNPESYARYGWVAATVMLVAILVSAIGTHHWIPRLRKPPVRPPRSMLAVGKEMYQTLAHRSFLMMLCAALCKGMALGISGSLALYMNTFFWQLTAPQLAILVLDGFFAALFAAWLTPRISKRFGKKITIIWFFALSFVIGVAPQVLRVMGLFFENGSPWLVPTLFVHGAIFGTFGIGSTILAASMIADCVEDSELRTGRRSEGLFFSASSLMQKAIGGLGVLWSGFILAIIAFPAKAKPGMVDQQILDNLVYTAVPASAVLYAIGTVCLMLYGIDRDKHEANVRELAASGKTTQSNAQAEAI